MKTPVKAFILLLGTASFISCTQQDAPPVDPQVGRDCFELHRPSLPPGTQYEGVESSVSGIQVKVMTGTELTTLECNLGPGGKPEVRGH